MVEEFKMKKALMQVLMYVCLMLPLGACSSDTPQEPEGGTTVPDIFPSSLHQSSLSLFDWDIESSRYSILPQKYD